MDKLSVQLLILVVFIGLMYFLLIRPQKKKEKEVNAMRESVSVGDKIVTIGGICGKVIRTGEDTIVIAVGADKTKLEMKRWCVSSVEEKGRGKAFTKNAPEKFGAAAQDEEEEKKSHRPRRMTRKKHVTEEKPADAVPEKETAPAPAASAEAAPQAENGPDAE